MAENQIRTLGPQEAWVVLTLRERNAEIIRATDIIHLLRSESSARTVIRNLLRKGWLTRLVGGRYLFLPPEHGPENLGENNPLALASAIVKPSYVGWWSAASHYGFTTQRPSTIAIAVLKAPPPRHVEGHEIRFVTLTRRKFFGYAPVKIFGREACLSSRAKTLVDCLDKPPLAGGPSELARITFGASRELDPEEVVTMAVAMDSTALLKRLGFLAELVGWQLPAAQRDRLRAAIPPAGRTVLGRAEHRPGDIGFVREWGLVVHLKEADLLADVPRPGG